MAIENKLGLTSSADLAREEERISKKKALELFENGMLDELEAGKFSALKAIHKYLFDEIYYFAGELRTVNISKGNFRFAPLMYLEAALANIGAALVFGSTSFSKQSFVRSLTGVKWIKKIIFSLWSVVLLKILKSNISSKLP